MAFLQITITELRGLFLASVYNFYAETKKVSNSRSGPLLLFGSNFLTHVWKISKTFIKKILLQGKYHRYSDPKLNSTFLNNQFDIVPPKLNFEPTLHFTDLEEYCTGCPGSIFHFLRAFYSKTRQVSP